MFEVFEYVDILPKNIDDNYIQITLEMIEGCLDDELDEMYDPWIPYKNEKNVINIPASKCFKTFQSTLYEEMMIDYCVRNHIKIVTERNTGKRIYLELKKTFED